MDRMTGDYNAFWFKRDYLNKIHNVKAAVLMAHAFNDWNVMPEHSVRIYEALNQRGLPCRYFAHQGGHGGDPPLEMINKWFTRFLYDVENGVEKEPKSWIVREDASEPTAYLDYPNPAAEPVQLFPSGEGSAQGTLGLTKVASPTIQKLIDDVSQRGAKLARAEHSANRLLYATGELKAPVHISGKSSIKIRLASSKPAANLSIWIVSLPWRAGGSINDNLITRGWADPQNHKSLTESEPLVPGQYYDLNFTLQPDDQVIPAGEKIGLMIFSSDRDFTLWPEAGTELSVDLNQTELTLPIVGGAEAFKTATGK
jgi:X-Pro dipeptidyl-peptidase